MEQLKNYLNQRIKELNQADADFCKDRWDMSKPANERGLYREESNKVTFARQELERTLKFINSLPTTELNILEIINCRIKSIKRNQRVGKGGYYKVQLSGQLASLRYLQEFIEKNSKPKPEPLISDIDAE